eukprot:7381785-Prymnesium_polylepis.2
MREVCKRCACCGAACCARGAAGDKAAAWKPSVYKDLLYDGRTKAARANKLLAECLPHPDIVPVARLTMQQVRACASYGNCAAPIWQLCSPLGAWRCGERARAKPRCCTLHWQ